MAHRKELQDATVNTLTAMVRDNNFSGVREILSQDGNRYLLFQGGVVDVTNLDRVDTFGIFPRRRIANRESGKPAMLNIQALPLAFGMGRLEICELILAHYSSIDRETIDVFLLQMETDPESPPDTLTLAAAIRKKLEETNYKNIGVAIALAQLEHEFPEGPGLIPDEDAYQVVGLITEFSYLAKELELTMQFRQQLARNFSDGDEKYMEKFALIKEQLEKAVKANAEKLKEEKEEKVEIEVKASAEDEANVRAQQEAEERARVKSEAREAEIKRRAKEKVEAEVRAKELEIERIRKIVDESLQAGESELADRKRQAESEMARLAIRWLSPFVVGIDAELAKVRKRLFIGEATRKAKVDALEFLRELCQANKIDDLKRFIAGMKFAIDNYHQAGRNFSPLLVAYSRIYAEGEITRMMKRISGEIEELESHVRLLSSQMEKDINLISDRLTGEIATVESLITKLHMEIEQAKAPDHLAKIEIELRLDESLSDDASGEEVNAEDESLFYITEEALRALGDDPSELVLPPGMKMTPSVRAPRAYDPFLLPAVAPAVSHSQPPQPSPANFKF